MSVICQDGLMFLSSFMNLLTHETYHLAIMQNLKYTDGQDKEILGIRRYFGGKTKKTSLCTQAWLRTYAHSQKPGCISGAHSSILAAGLGSFCSFSQEAYAEIDSTCVMLFLLDTQL